MKIIILLIALLGSVTELQAQHADHSMPHEMQHGFVLAINDNFASHLVANGHHSRQVEITGKLFINDHQELKIYKERKKLSDGQTYFLFQAQNLDLPSIKNGQLLSGHIVESKMGEYESKNIIVKNATYKIDNILLNIVNPFFLE